MINREFAHIVLWPRNNEAGARAFAADLPADWIREIEPPGEPDDETEPDNWVVTVWGPWDDPENGADVLEPLATRHGGEYDGEEEFEPGSTIL